MTPVVNKSLEFLHSPASNCFKKHALDIACFLQLAGT